MAVIPMNDVQFEETVASGQLFLAAFWTDWSEDCTELPPVLEELAKQYQGRAVIGTVNADQEGFLAMELGIVTLPTVILYKDGIEMDRVAGYNSASFFGRLLNVRLLPDDDDDTPPGYI